jgi:hypothetical protein
MRLNCVWFLYLNQTVHNQSSRYLIKINTALQRGRLALELIGEFELKGIRRPLAAHNVLALKSAS